MSSCPESLRPATSCLAFVSHFPPCSWFRETGGGAGRGMTYLFSLKTPIFRGQPCGSGCGCGWSASKQYSLWAFGRAPGSDGPGTAPEAMGADKIGDYHSRLQHCAGLLRDTGLPLEIVGKPSCRLQGVKASNKSAAASNRQNSSQLKHRSLQRIPPRRCLRLGS